MRGEPLSSRVRVRNVNFSRHREVGSGSFSRGVAVRGSEFEGRDLDNINLAAETGERQVTDGTAAVVAVTDDCVGKVDDFVFERWREGDTVRLARDMNCISDGSAVAATVHRETAQW